MKERNSNCLKGLRCPECGSLGPFRIVATCLVLMSDEGSEEATDFEWGQDSSCKCCACGRIGDIIEFGETAFHCPKCGGGRLEEISVDCVVSSEICNIRGDDETESADADYQLEIIDGDDSHVNRYQCIDCDYIPRRGDGTPVNNLYDMYRWLLARPGER